MTTETVLTNARIVLVDDVISGSVQIVDGRIADVSNGASKAAGAIDLDGDHLIPGLVELHTDHLETHYHPRPRVNWPPIPAALAHDAQIVAAGITTVYDAVYVGNHSFARHERTANDSVVLVKAVADAQDAGLLRAEHHVHLRCEIVDDGVVEGVKAMLGQADVRLMSLMDHTPGQRQFVNVDKLREYYAGKEGMTDAEIDRYIEDRVAQQERVARTHRDDVVEIARERGIPLASHDDATVEHVEEACADGVSISEFPTTEAAAKAAHAKGLMVLMGGPNVVRGGSHSGNVSARTLAETGTLDILSSDYVPASLVMSACFLAREIDTMDLPAAIRLVTANPAGAVGLDDRGEIAIGKRADLVRLHFAKDVEAIRSVWREGIQVL